MNKVFSNALGIVHWRTSPDFPSAWHEQWMAEFSFLGWTVPLIVKHDALCHYHSGMQLCDFNFLYHGCHILGLRFFSCNISWRQHIQLFLIVGCRWTRQSACTILKMLAWWRYMKCQGVPNMIRNNLLEIQAPADELSWSTPGGMDYN